MFKADNKNTNVVLVFLLLTLNIFHTFFSVSIVDFEQIIISWAFFNTTESIIFEDFLCIWRWLAKIGHTRYHWGSRLFLSLDIYKS